MTVKEEAKDKAKELINKFLDSRNTGDLSTDGAIEGALICVNVTIEALEHHSWQNRHIIEEYEELKKEIENYE